jgi:DNA-binding response OmpR family regulator
LVRKRKCLLLVDDNTRNLIALEACLTPFGFDIVTATSGRDALSKFELCQPDLILLDVKLPDISGIDVLRKIRSHATLSQTPTILVTAYTEDDLRLQGLDAAADEFLQKPFDLAILQARVKTLLWLKESRDELSLRNAALERLQKQQRELIDFIVHDLKAPLSVISVNVDWVSEQLADQQPAVDARTSQALEQAASAGQRMKALINDLLSVARLDQGAIAMRIESVAVQSVIETAAARYAVALERKSLSLSIEPSKLLYVEADAELLQRAFDHLFESAIQLTPAGGVLEISAREHSQVQITVDGRGTAVVRQATGTRSNLEETSGAGIGLYFCGRVLEALGGSLDSIESSPNTVRYRVCLPSFHDRESGAFTCYTGRNEGTLSS